MQSEWQLARNKGLGGSDMATIMGLSKWKGPLTLWAEKTGKIAPEDLDDQEHVEWGNRLEDPIMDAYWEKTERLPGNVATDRYGLRWVGGSRDDGTKLHDHHGEGKLLIQHPSKPFLLGSPDSLIKEYRPFPWEDHVDWKWKGPGILEVKTTNAFNKADWDAGPPDYYVCQAQHYMGVTGLEWASFAVLIGGQELRIFDVPRDDELIEEMQGMAERFWVSVINRTPPDPSHLDCEAATIFELYKGVPDTMVELPNEAQKILDTLDTLAKSAKPFKDKLKILGDREKSLKNTLKMMMGNAAVGLLPGGEASVTFKQVNRKPYTVNPKPFRQLRIRRARRSSQTT